MALLVWAALLEERSRITHAPTVLQERQYHLILSKRAQGSGALLARFSKLEQGKIEEPHVAHTVIEKPFEMETLARVVRQALDKVVP
jgi:hypothetical protein